MAELRLKQIRKCYGDGNGVIHGLDLTVRDGEFMVFVGPSGCGKSTLLRMIAGLESLSAGELWIGERRADELPPAQRGVAMVFQSYALYPHMTVRENMGFGLKLAGLPRREIDAAVERAAAALQLTELLERKPKALSGGQRQRVAIGRAIVRKPQVFLFDEPLSNLDAALRVQMRIELARLHQELATTMIYVTHDQVEAMTLGERIAVFNSGRIEQVGTPLELYERPANLFVAGFLGSPRMNLLPAVAESDGRLRLPAGFVLDLGVAALPGETLTLGARPEHLHLAGRGLPGRLDLVEHLGDCQLLHISVEGVAEPLALKLPGHAQAPALGEPVRIGFDPAFCHLFDHHGQALAPREAPVPA
ncbi:ABC transporter ATP-binding protein [Chitinimonas lacunae]|uniref:ABC transporter ATP-binding protein n=1 Tax=Chitinimonas lacunae TaxID=1963018 RepID=A0ABV8MNE4_9NEIS